jgi:hypothetical protein
LITPLDLVHKILLRAALELELDLRASDQATMITPTLERHVDAVVVDRAIDAVQPCMRG